MFSDFSANGQTKASLYFSAILSIDVFIILFGLIFCWKVNELNFRNIEGSSFIAVCLLEVEISKELLLYQLSYSHISERQDSNLRPIG